LRPVPCERKVASESKALEAAWCGDDSHGGRLLIGGVVAVCLHLALLGIPFESPRPRPGRAGTAIEVSLIAAASPPEQPATLLPSPVPPTAPPVAKPPLEKSVPRPKAPEPPVARSEEPVAAPTPTEVPAAEAAAPSVGLPGETPLAGTAGLTAPVQHAARTSGAQGLISARPRYKTNPKPRYPLMARRRRQEGVVLLSVSVSASGGPVAIEIQASSGISSLDQAAVDAVRRWEFEPGVLDGEAVPSRVEVPIRFELE